MTARRRRSTIHQPVEKARISAFMIVVKWSSDRVTTGTSCRVRRSGSIRSDRHPRMPSREVSRIGGLDLCQAKAKTKARHRAIGELSIGRSFKRSEYFQHLSWTAIRRLSNAAILSRPGWHGRRNCPAGPHNWALGRARRCRGDRRDVKGPGISVSNPSHGMVDRDRASPVANSARFVSMP